MLNDTNSSCRDSKGAYQDNGKDFHLRLVRFTLLKISPYYPPQCMHFQVQ